LANNSLQLLKKSNIFLNSPIVSTGVFAVVALVFTKYYFLFTSEYYPPSYACKIASFEADKVFQKRFLIPLSANFISQNTPLSFDHSLKFITAISTLGLLYYFKKILEILSKSLATHYWCLFLLIPVGWNYMFINSIYHSYDIPSLFFYCFCLYLFLSKKYFLFYIIFTVATLNRESTCFVTISLALLLSKFSSECSFKDVFILNSNLLKHLVAQTTLWLLIVLLIGWFVKDSRGQSYEVTYSMSIFIANMWNGSSSWPFLNTETFFGNPRCFLTLFGCTWLLIPLLWKYIPSDCKKLLLLIPIYMIPALLHANLMETRVYQELNVVITLAFTSGLIEFRALRNKVI
jgi:hypothetical protein